MVLRPLSRNTVLQASYIVIIIATSIQMTYSINVNKAKNSSAEIRSSDNSCKSFTIRHLDQRTFFSPGYPGPYTASTTCYTRIDAKFPSTIELEFKELFNIESSVGCEYDGLMIRDGPYAFSKLIGKYCGSNLPETVKSSGQSLWLKFYSDDAIQAQGFRAVYRFIKQEVVRPQIEECFLDVNGQSGEIKMEDIPFKFLNYSKQWNIPLTCIWRIKVQLHSKIFLKVMKFSLADATDCDENFIEIVGKDLISDQQETRICHASAEPVTVSGKVAHLIFYSQPLNIDSNFIINWKAIDKPSKSSRTSVASMYGKNYTADSPLLENPCYNFTVRSMEQRNLYSPGYPNLYRKEANCITRIDAPFPDIVELDFRDQFNIEKSANCEYDGLVIRDGPYGFSKVLEKHCGNKFPPIIRSSGQSLWLQFYSDETIEYEGFRAVYKFVKQEAARPKIDDCVFDVTGYAGEIKIEDIPQRFINYTRLWDIPLTCIWKIEVQPGWKVYIAFKEFTLVVPNDCDENFIDIHGGDLLSDQSVEIFCSTLSEPRRVKGNVAHVTFYSMPDVLDAKFHIIWTAYRDRGKHENCAKNEFQCDEDTCIDASLKCDGHENCEQQNDEDVKNICATEDKFAMLKKEHMIFILVLACGMIIGICVSTCLRCRRKLKEHNEQMKKMKERRSKESSIAANLDSALATQIVQRKSDRMRKYSDEINNDDCHVPDVGGIAMNVMGNKYPNGGRSISRDDHSEIMLDSQDDINRDPDKLPRYNYDHNRCDPPPPPPPPPRFRDWSAQYDGSNQCAIHSNRTQNPPSYKQYMASTPEDSEIDNDLIPPAPPPPTSRPPKSGRQPSANMTGPPSTRSPQRFRAEAVIEMSQQDQRPRSFESTKSAPDVIVTH